MQRVVIVGGSLGGLRAAEQLRMAGFEGELAIVSAETHRPYNRPPLSKEGLLATASIDELELTARVDLGEASWLFGRAAVTSDLVNRSVELDDGSRLEFDGLVIASGIRPRRLSAARPLAGVHVMRTWQDSQGLKADLRPGARLVIVGAGFIGCEIAACARELGCSVTIVSSDPVPLRRSVGRVVGEIVRVAHEDRGVVFRSGVGATGYLGDETVTGVELADGSRLPADVVLEAIGSTPNVEWLEGNGLDLSDGVLCDQDMRVLDAEGVVAVGDVAKFPNRRFDDIPRRVEHWNIPVETAKRAARTLAGALAGDEADQAEFRPLPAFWSKQYDFRLQAYGLPHLADRVVELDESIADRPVFSYMRGEMEVGVVAFGNGPTLIRRGAALGRSVARTV
jgi:3-phenylpropionate/trans-cinnamate dioxygenase ferredoxin reductase subunit